MLLSDFVFTINKKTEVSLLKELVHSNVMCLLYIVTLSSQIDGKQVSATVQNNTFPFPQAGIKLQILCTCENRCSHAHTHHEYVYLQRETYQRVGDSPVMRENKQRYSIQILNIIERR